MPPMIVREGEAKFTFGATIVDLSCDAWALELGSDTEEIDIGTFCEPGAQDLGRTTYTAVLSLLWSPDLYTKLAAHVGETGVFSFAPDPAAPTERIEFDSRYAALPWGRFEIGQRVEVDLPLGVLAAPQWLTA